jgi:hypothetical protein
MIAPSPTIEAIRLDPNYAVAFHNRGIAIASEANALNQHRLLSSKAADYLLALHSDHGDEMLLVQQPCQILVAWHGMLVSIDFSECFPEHPKQVLEQRHVRARELLISIAVQGNHAWANCSLSGVKLGLSIARVTVQIPA